MKKILPVLLIGYFLFTCTVCFAEDKKEEWAKNAYPFNQLQTVLVQYSIQPDITLSESERQKLDTAYHAAFFKPDKKTKLTYITLAEAEAALGKFLNLQLAELKITNYPEYEALFKAHLPSIASAVLNVTITDQHYSTAHIAERLETYTAYEYKTVYRPYINSFGQHAGNTATTIQVPVTKTRLVPAHDIQVIHAGVNFVLEDTKTQQPVWRLTVNREASDKNPLSVTERIFDDAKTQLDDLQKQKKAKK